jgi:hypothetical protein
MKIRPTGITLIGYAFIILSALSFLWSLLVFGVGGVSSLFTSVFTFSPTVSGSVWSGMLGMVTAAVQFAAGIGLLQMKEWAWYVAVLGAGLSLLQGITGMFTGGIFTFFCGFLGLLVPGGILIYLLQGRIRALFNIGT